MALSLSSFQAPFSRLKRARLHDREQLPGQLGMALGRIASEVRVDLEPICRVVPDRSAGELVDLRGQRLHWRIGLQVFDGLHIRERPVPPRFSQQ